jgi:hypothetical protein
MMQVALDLAEMDAVPGDSAIYVAGSNLRRVLFGVDVGVAELLLARELRVDGVVAHHPAGGEARLRFGEVLDTHARLLEAHGVPAGEAAAATATLRRSADFAAHASNFDHAPSAARLLEIPFLNVHLPLDELGRKEMQAAVDALAPGAAVSDVVNALASVPELAGAPTRIAVRAGRADAPAGRTVVVHGAGTNGGYPVADAYFRHGVGTVVYIHVNPAEAERLAAEGRGNLVVTGHIASDLIGINRYVAELERRGVEVVRFSGL